MNCKKFIALCIATLNMVGANIPAMAQPVPEPPGFDPGAFNPHTWYVSKNGNNADGKSWATAWSDFDQIQWANINYARRDKIEIDGGASRMVYRKPLRIQIGSSGVPAPTSISVSKQTGHNGQAVLIAPMGSHAIEIVTGPVQLDGSKRSGLLVVGGSEGLSAHAGSGSYPSVVKNLEIAYCSEAGMHYTAGSGMPVALKQTIIHDCATNVLSSGTGVYSAGDFEKCWIYNSSYRPNSDGFRQEAPNNGMFLVGLYIRNSVIGPGLRDGVNTQGKALPLVRDCLFINSTRNNINAQTAYIDNITSFMTRLNPWQKAHSAIKFYPGAPVPELLTAHVNNSVVYGGVVDIPLTAHANFPPPHDTVPFPIIVNNNTQFCTSGNTTVLSASMVDPMFTSNVGSLPNQTPVFLLMNQDFSLRPGSPATGTGSAVTSIRQLLGSFQ